MLGSKKKTRETTRCEVRFFERAAVRAGNEGASRDAVPSDQKGKYLNVRPQ